MRGGCLPAVEFCKVAVSAAQDAGCRPRWATAGRAVRFTRFRSVEAGQRSTPAGGAPFATPAGADSRRLGPLPSARATPVETRVPGWGCVDCAPRRARIAASPGPGRTGRRNRGRRCHTVGGQAQLVELEDQPALGRLDPGERGHPGRVRVSKSWLITLLATASASPRAGSTPAQLPPAARPSTNAATWTPSSAPVPTSSSRISCTTCCTSPILAALFPRSLLSAYDGPAARLSSVPPRKLAGCSRPRFSSSTTAPSTPS
jgi:hypothetical protein